MSLGGACLFKLGESYVICESVWHLDAVSRSAHPAGAVKLNSPVHTVARDGGEGLSSLVRLVDCRGRLLLR